MQDLKQKESTIDSTQKIKSLILLANEEKSNLQNQVTKINFQMEAIENVLQLLKGPAFAEGNTFMPVVKEPAKAQYRIENDQYADYPLNGSCSEKILYILEKGNVAMLMVEILEVILNIEGPIRGKRTIKLLKTGLKQLVTRGEILSGKVANSRRHQFYILPHFLDEFSKLKNEHYPNPKSFGSLNEEKRSTIANCF